MSLCLPIKKKSTAGGLRIWYGSMVHQFCVLILHCRLTAIFVNRLEYMSIIICRVRVRKPPFLSFDYFFPSTPARITFCSK